MKNYNGQGIGFYRIIGTLIISVIVILLIAGLCGLSGCKFAEKAVAKYQASAAFPKACADSFPVVTDSIYVEGGWTTDSIYFYDTQTLFDTVTQKIDTVIYKTKVVTNRKVDTIRVTKEDSARLKQYILQLIVQTQVHKKEVELLTNQLAKSKAATENEKRKTKRNAKQRNIGWGIIAAFAAYNFRHQLIGLLSGGFGKIGLFIFGLLKRKKP